MVDRRLLEVSWQWIFDLHWSHPDYSVPLPQKSAQGVAWEIRPQDVRRIDHFVAR